MPGYAARKGSATVGVTSPNFCLLAGSMLAFAGFFIAPNSASALPFLAAFAPLPVAAMLFMVMPTGAPMPVAMARSPPAPSICITVSKYSP